MSQVLLVKPDTSSRGQKSFSLFSSSVYSASVWSDKTNTKPCIIKKNHHWSYNALVQRQKPSFKSALWLKVIQRFLIFSYEGHFTIESDVNVLLLFVFLFIKMF